MKKFEEVVSEKFGKGTVVSIVGDIDNDNGYILVEFQKRNELGNYIKYPYSKNGEIQTLQDIEDSIIFTEKTSDIWQTLS